MTTPAPICWGCRHLRKGNTCNAFPKKIPDPILVMEVVHTKPYPGDRGIQFEPKTRTGRIILPSRRPQ